jgi:hypothetical protein
MFPQLGAEQQATVVDEVLRFASKDLDLAESQARSMALLFEAPSKY